MKNRFVSIFLLICCLFSLTSCGVDTDAQSADNPTAAEASVQVDKTDTDSTVPEYSGDLAYYADLPDKSVCKGKIIEVSGEYTKKFLVNYYIGSIDDDFYIYLYFDKKTDEIEELTPGDIITVKGKCASSKDGNMMLSSCTLVSVGASDSTNDSSEPSDIQGPIPDTQPVDTPSLPEGSTFSVHFIDVGQADAALVECDGHYMLIDGGNKADSSKIYSILKKDDITHLDIVVGTHAHEDHIGGIPGAFNYADADLTLCATGDYSSDAFDDFKKYADQKGGGIVIPTVGDTYSLGSASIKILGVNGGNNTNDTSIVLMITYGETKFLFTGDAEREAEQAILESGADLSATVLKVGHHGSNTSTTYPFLREIMPAYAVISVGAGNSYGHPSEDTLSRLRDADVKVYRTDLQGDIKCSSDGKTVTFSVAKNADIDTLESVAKPDSTTTPSQTVAPEPEPEPDPVPNGSYYVLNTNSKKFHSPGCGSVGKISASNKEYSTETAEELVAKGYSPCGNCKPYVLPEPEPEPTPVPTQSETMVWIPKSGSKYHSYSGCSNMKNPSQVTISQAQARGYSPCKKCW